MIQNRENQETQSERTETTEPLLGVPLSRLELLAIILGAIALGAVLVFLYAPSLSSYRLAGDDFGPIRASARQFDPDIAGWFTHGYRGYFVAYPELGEGAGLLRPATNASLWVDSWLAEPESALFLVQNYLGHILALVLMTLIGRQLLKLPWFAVVASSALFLVSASTAGLFISAPFRSDMLAAIAATSGPLVIIGSRRGPTTNRVLVASGLATLAMYFKETGVVAPLLLLAALAWRHRRSPRTPLLPPPRQLALAILPLLLYSAHRLLVPFGDIYVLQDPAPSFGGVPAPLLNVARFMATAFVPIHTQLLKEVTDFSRVSLTSILVATLVSLNVVLWWATWRAVSGKPNEHARFVALMALLASAVPLALKADPRFMYLSQVWMLPLGAHSLLRMSVRRGFRPLFVTTVTLFLTVALVTNVAMARQESEDKRELNQRQDLIRSALLATYADNDVSAVYSALERPGEGAKQRLDFYAALANRNDVTTRVVVRYLGDAPLVSWSTNDLGAEFNYAGATATSFFPFVHPDRLTQLGQPGIVRYKFNRDSQGTESVSAFLPYHHGTSVAVWFDEQTSSMRILTFDRETAQVRVAP